MREQLKPVDWGILSELVKNSRLSDRQLARLVGVSQPTATRRRGELERERMLDYTAVPDLKRIGFEILAIILAKWKRGQYPDTNVQAAKNFIDRHPNIIFVSTGLSSHADRIAISVHRDYQDYAKFMQEVKTEWGEFMTTDTFLVSLSNDNILRHLSFKYLTDYLKKVKPQ
jgi:DNA-binding Lrp family transcriptional regulator